jgi:hypothetical protein
MSILKYKDPKTGEFKRINPYKAELSFVGKDGIVVNKEHNSEMVEISGSGLVQNYNGPKGYYRAYVTDYTNWNTNMIIRQEGDNSANTLLQRKADGSGEIVMPENPVDLSITNKKYVADNYVEKVKFTNLEQALNGYILDTNKEAYADLDSAVLKNSVAVGDNVYPIADKTRALVSRIEGKTTKMVQLLDKSVIPATQTVNGITYTNNNDGSITINGTATAESYIIIVARDKVTNGNKILFGSEQNTSDYGVAWGTILNSSKFITSTTRNNYTVKVNSGVTVDKVKIYPQLFDLTAMNREDITTVEQFKAGFPDLYPYENGNIYPAKISGVKFTGKNLKNIPNGIGSKDYAANELPKNISLALSARLSLKEGNARVRASWIKNGTREYTYGNIITASTGISKVVFTIPSSATDTRIALQTFGDDVGFEYSNVQIEAGTAATAYEPYIEPVSVTLPETYDLHGIDDNKDYLEITKNEDNELYTLKKVQVIEKVILNGTENWTPYSYGDKPFTNVGYSTPLNPKFIKWTYRGTMMNLLNKLPTVIIDQKGYGAGDESATLYVRLPNIATAADMKAHVLSMYEAGTPYIFYGAIATPVETVIAANLTYEQVTAIRHNGSLIEVEGNTNKGYAKPTIKNTIVYRLTATNKAEG